MNEKEAFELINNFAQSVDLYSIKPTKKAEKEMEKCAAKLYLKLTGKKMSPDQKRDILN